MGCGSSKTGGYPGYKYANTTGGVNAATTTSGMPAAYSSYSSPAPTASATHIPTNSPGHHPTDSGFASGFNNSPNNRAPSYLSNQEATPVYASATAMAASDEPEIHVNKNSWPTIEAVPINANASPSYQQQQHYQQPTLNDNTADYPRTSTTTAGVPAMFATPEQSTDPYAGVPSIFRPP